MNEKIKELAETALKSSMVHDGVYRPEGYANSVSKEFADKFAELIVKECAKFLEDNSGYDDSNNSFHPEPEDLLNHFGVEE
jgi:hypothetical protein